MRCSISLNWNPEVAPPAHLNADIHNHASFLSLNGATLQEAGEPSEQVPSLLPPQRSKSPRYFLASAQDKAGAGALDQAGFGAAIKKYAAHYGLDEKLIWAVIRQESGCNPQAVSPKGAMGVMQLMPGTALLMGVKDPFNAEENIAGGVKYLKLCLDRFGQDVSLALAAYNAGPEAVAKYGGCPPFPETQNYVAAVMRNYGKQPPPQRLAAKTPSPPATSTHPQPKNSGLSWRVPAPQWKIAAPQCKVPPPRWKKGPS